MGEQVEVAVVGGGFSGALTAGLLALAGRAGRVALVERVHPFARGVAYSTPQSVHLLNVPAGRMSALADDPGHFLRWWQERTPAARADAFAPRAVYGDYLSSWLAEIERAHPDRLYLRAGEVQRISREAGGFVLTRPEGLLRARRVVLAQGNLPPLDPPLADCAFAKSPFYVGDPWLRGVLDDVPADAPVLLVGTGLTMVDVALTLQAQGHRGALIAVSRRGLVPRAHAPSEPISAEPLVPGPLGSLVRQVQRQIEESGGNWRAVIDALRPQTQALWAQLSLADKRRFLRHLRPWWDVHRHRMAPQVAEAIAAMRASGQLVAQSGRLLQIVPHGEGLRVHLRSRGGEREDVLDVARVVNCTGPTSDLRRTSDPLVRQLLADGLARPDPLGLGYETSEEGEASPGLFVVGPLRRARTWEATAVPELRVQATAMAKSLGV